MRMFLLTFWAMFAMILPSAARAQSAPPPTAAELELYFDGIVPYALAEAGIPGAAVSVVKDDRILFAKGYGVADLATRRPVTADATLFRIGSVSKLFTWTAVMQLVEQGKLDLDKDVNAYLDFRIPDTYPGKITLRLLMTHRAGFEEVSRGMSAYGGGADSLGRYVRNHLPNRIFAPGTRPAYSNYGAALAGYIVERVSGEPYHLYVERHILAPLGMARTTVLQPPPGALGPMTAQSYASSAEPEAIPYGQLSLAPAGSIATTAADMGRFLIAELQQGRLGDAAILRPETLAEMQRVQYRAAPGRNGFTLGFWEANRNGYRILGHSGDIPQFHANLYFAPERGYGIFVALNATGVAGRKLGSDLVRDSLARGFFDRFVPGRVADEPTVAPQQFDAERVAGYYRSTRHNMSGPQLERLFMGDDEVTAEADGTIAIASRLAPDGTPKRWRQVGPLTYREIGGQAHLSFVADKDGRILYWIGDDYPPAMVFERVEGIFATGLVQPLYWIALVSSTLFALGALVAWWRRAKGVRAERSWTLSRIGHGWIALVLIGWIGVAMVGGLDDDLMLLNIVRGASVVAAVAALLPLLHAVRTVGRPPRRFLAGAVEILGTLLALYAAWFLVSQHMAGFSNSF